MPAYQQVARQFADMHDTPARMVAKGVLRGVVPWRQVRGSGLERPERPVQPVQSVWCAVERGVRRGDQPSAITPLLL